MSSFPTCQVCHQQFSLKGPAPFLLPCLHCICETCVTSAAGGVISCSTCQRDVNLTETRLQKDGVTEKEILNLTIKQNPELVLCTHEGDGNQAVCWCIDCEDFLCENCQMIHGSFKATRKHDIHEIGELHPNHLDVDTYCSDHPKHILDIWDEQCSTLICRKCQDGDHVDHSSGDFEEAVKLVREKVADFGKELLSSGAQQGTYLTTMDTDIEASDESCDILTETISNTFNSLKSLINQREKELQIELQQHQVKVRRDLNEKKNTSEACQKKCQTTSDYINKTLQYSSRHDIMSLRHILQSKTGECISSAQAIVYESPPLPRFNTVGLEKIKSLLAEFGELVWMEDPVIKNKDNSTQTEEWILEEFETLKQELVQMKASHDKEIQVLRETLTRQKDEEKKGLNRLREDNADAAYLLKCIHVEFNRAKCNTEDMHISAEGQLINKVQTNLQQIEQRLVKYRGTSSVAPLLMCASPQYFEVKTRLGIDKTLTGNNLLLEIGFTREGHRDQSLLIGGRPKSYSLTVAHCSTHNSICRHVWRHGKHLMCLPDTLKNTPGTSDTLHIGVVYDTVRRYIAFLDVKDEKIIGMIKNVDSSCALWAMFGVYNTAFATVIMSLIVGNDIDMTGIKKALVLGCLS